MRETPRLWDGQKLLDHGLDVLVAGGEPIVFLLHGYNNSRDEGMKALEGFAAAARGARPELGSMRFVGVLWPGDSRVGFLSYPTEERSADHTAR